MGQCTTYLAIEYVVRIRKLDLQGVDGSRATRIIRKRETPCGYLHHSPSSEISSQSRSFQLLRILPMISPFSTRLKFPNPHLKRNLKLAPTRSLLDLQPQPQPTLYPPGPTHPKRSIFFFMQKPPQLSTLPLRPVNRLPSRQTYPPSSQIYFKPRACAQAFGSKVLGLTDSTGCGLRGRSGCAVG